MTNNNTSTSGSATISGTRVVNDFALAISSLDLMKVGIEDEYGMKYYIPAHSVGIMGKSGTEVRWAEKKDTSTKKD